MTWRPCRIDGCPNSSELRDPLCAAHYANKRLRGDPLALGQNAITRRAIDALFARVHTPAAREAGECWHWPGTSFSPHGYGNCNRNGQKIASRATWVETYGPIPEGMWVLHKCDNPPCVRPSHLYLGTPARNTRDMVERGRQVTHVNEANARTVVATEDVQRIRERVASGEMQKLVAEDYGIHPAHVSRLCSGKRRSYA